MRKRLAGQLFITGVLLTVAIIVAAAEVNPRKAVGMAEQSTLGRESPLKPVIPTDWPTYRHDSALTAASPVAGGFSQAPHVEWTLDLGGPPVASEQISLRDVTGDGREEILILRTESLTCRDAYGAVLWELEGIPTPTILDVRDYAGDGTRGILLSSYLAGRTEVFMVSGKTGTAITLWVSENNFGGVVRFGKLLPQVRGFQVGATASGVPAGTPWGGDVWLVSFADGLENPFWNVRQHVVGILYAPRLLFSDLDADGRDEMVVISHEEIWTFDTETGSQKFHAQYSPNIRTYSGTIAAIKLAPHDPHPTLVMINPHIPGLKAVQQDGRTAATTLWKVVVGKQEDQYQAKVRIVPGGADCVYDLNGDDRYEIVASITNEHDDEKTHLTVFDTRDGKRLGEFDDLKIVSVDDLDGDGKPEVVLQDKKTYQIAHWTGSDFQLLWQADDFEPLLRTAPSEGDLSRSSGINMRVQRNGLHSREFLGRFPDGDWNCRFKVEGLERISKHTPAAALIREEVISLEQGAVVTRVKGAEVFRYAIAAPPTYLAPPPLVADFSTGRKVFVRHSDGRWLRHSENGKLEGVMFERPLEKFQVHVDPAGSGPTLCDMDGDGRNDILATATDADGTPYCGIFDEQGELIRRMDLLPGTRLVNRGPTGSLGPGLGRWVILRMYYGEGSYQGRQPLVVAFDGKTGRQLWVRDHYSHYGTNPVSFAAHLPTATFDYDGDGSDDWVVCSENFYGIISVKDNRDLVPSVVLSDAVPGHWTAYTYPSLVSLPGKNERRLFHSNAYSMALVTNLEGQAVWHEGMTRDTGSGWGIAADLDGDGLPEFIHPQADGTLRCFNTEAGTGKCASCPPSEMLSSHNHTGIERWHFPLKRPVSRIIAADLNADGKQDLLFGGHDGILYAVTERAGKPEILWSLKMNRRVGEPILVDLNSDGRGEILVPVEDGKLYCLSGK